MSASPTWLEGMARGAARRELRGRQADPPVAEWGARRLSRRTTIGSAATAVVAMSALRHVSPALAQGGAPPCQSPCLKEAARNRDGANESSARDRDIASRPLYGKLAGLEYKLRHTTSKSKRAAIQAQINSVNAGLSRLVQQEILNQLQSDRNFENNSRRCKSDGECGNPTRYPGGRQAPPAGTEGGGLSRSPDTAPCNCGGDVTFLCCLKYFSCKECCG